MMIADSLIAAVWRARFSAAVASAPASGFVPPPRGGGGSGPTDASAPGRSRRRRLRKVLAAVMLTLGTILVADSIVTVVWQEPFTALYAAHEQHRLSSQLAQLTRSYGESVPAAVTTPPPRTHTATVRRRHKPSPMARFAVLARRLERSTRAGQPLGRIEVHSLHLSFVVVQGTDTASLTEGPGHYRGTALPGVPGTTAIAGHRTTFLAPFRHIDDLRRGARVVLSMPYGRFVYAVSGERIVNPTDVAVLAPHGSLQELILTSCDPPFSAAARRVVFARLVSAKPVSA
jgi:LPXTG-site transpeptidase (sortase) family protein